MEMRGLRELREALETAPTLVRSRLETAVAYSTFRLYNAIQSGAWYRTGQLRGSITYRARGLHGRVEIGADGWYWAFLEFGTVKMAARPVIRPAGEQEAPNFERSMVDAGRALEQSWSRVA